MLAMATEQASPTARSLPTVPAERYVATNRFRVKEGREAAFEKRWADRQSRLGLLDGFRFFCMMRRVAGEEPAEDDVNYISCTVWDDFSNFDAWKRGDAFKEAHGGGTIGGIASMLVATARNTKGKPKPAMWEGLLPVSGAAASTRRAPRTPPPSTAVCPVKARAETPPNGASHARNSRQGRRKRPALGSDRNPLRLRRRRLRTRRVRPKRRPDPALYTQVTLGARASPKGRAAWLHSASQPSARISTVLYRSHLEYILYLAIAS